MTPQCKFLAEVKTCISCTDCQHWASPAPPNPSLLRGPGRPRPKPPKSGSTCLSFSLLPTISINSSALMKPMVLTFIVTTLGYPSFQLRQSLSQYRIAPLTIRQLSPSIW